MCRVFFLGVTALDTTCDVRLAISCRNDLLEEAFKCTEEE